MRPVPLQRGHACVRTNSPKTLRETCWSRPAPPQVSQRTGSVPGSAPSPPQRRALRRDLERHLPDDAVRSLDELDLDLDGDVRSVRRALRAAPAAEKRSSPKKAEKMSERFPRSK